MPVIALRAVCTQKVTSTLRPVTCNHTADAQKPECDFSNSRRDAIADRLSKIELSSQCDRPLVVRRSRLAG